METSATLSQRVSARNLKKIKPREGGVIYIAHVLVDQACPWDEAIDAVNSQDSNTAYVKNLCRHYPPIGERSLVEQDLVLFSSLKGWNSWGELREWADSLSLKREEREGLLSMPAEDFFSKERLAAAGQRVRPYHRKLKTLFERLSKARKKIVSVGDFLSIPQDDLLSIRGVGIKMHKVAQAVIRHNGLG